MGRAIAPAGASTGSGEAKSVDVPKAVHNIGTRIRDGLRALSVSDQAKIDERLIDLDGTPDRSRLGANAMVAVSLACAHADAAAEKVPLEEARRRPARRAARAADSDLRRRRARAPLRCPGLHDRLHRRGQLRRGSRMDGAGVRSGGRAAREARRAPGGG